MNFFKMLTAKKSESNCCGIEIKEVNEESNANNESCCSSDEKNNDACCD